MGLLDLTFLLAFTLAFSSHFLLRSARVACLLLLLQLLTMLAWHDLL